MNKYGCLLLLFVCGCSTTWKKRTLAYMGASFVTGAVVGASQADEDQNKELHGLLWGAVASAAVGGTLIYLYDEDNEIEEKNKEIESLNIELSMMKNEGKQFVDKGESSFYESSLPGSIQNLVEPGEWKMYEIDEWKKLSNGVMVHQDKLLEIKEPKIRIQR